MVLIAISKIIIKLFYLYLTRILPLWLKASRLRTRSFTGTDIFGQRENTAFKPVVQSIRDVTYANMVCGRIIDYIELGFEVRVTLP